MTDTAMGRGSSRLDTVEIYGISPTGAAREYLYKISNSNEGGELPGVVTSGARIIGDIFNTAYPLNRENSLKFLSSVFCRN
jgi:hypothetical protein